MAPLFLQSPHPQASSARWQEGTPQPERVPLTRKGSRETAASCSCLLGYCMMDPLWFHTNQTRAKLRYMGVAGNKEEKSRAASVSHSAHDHSAQVPVRRGAMQLYCWRNRWLPQQPYVDPLQCRPVFIPQMLTFPWASLLSLSLLPFSPTSPEPGSAQAAGAFLCGCMSARRQPRHWWLFPTAVCAFRSRSSSCVSAQCRPDTCYWVYSHVHAYGKILQPWNAHQQPGPLKLLVGLD